MEDTGTKCRRRENQDSEHGLEIKECICTHQHRPFCLDFFPNLNGFWISPNFHVTTETHEHGNEEDTGKTDGFRSAKAEETFAANEHIARFQVHYAETVRELDAEN
mmetsp:Transcript_33866/g.62742  ORF Transcript_33866/g.62742 Transcript_33866/m.62742 type:complete len:106 (+) Transcript_33866:912-1229(+)